MMVKRNPTMLAVSEIFGIILLVLGVVILNLLTSFIQNPFYLEVVSFFNVNLIFLIILSLVFFVGDLFAVFIFPVNLPAPIFRAIASTLLVVFIVRIFELLETFFGTEVFTFIKYISPFVYALVFFLVLILGYVGIFSEIGRREKRREEMLRRKQENAIKEKQDKKIEEPVSKEKKKSNKKR